MHLQINFNRTNTADSKIRRTIDAHKLFTDKVDEQLQRRTLQHETEEKRHDDDWAAKQANGTIPKRQTRIKQKPPDKEAIREEHLKQLHEIMDKEMRLREGRIEEGKLDRNTTRIWELTMASAENAFI